MCSHCPTRMGVPGQKDLTRLVMIRIGPLGEIYTRDPLYDRFSLLLSAAPTEANSLSRRQRIYLTFAADPILWYLFVPELLPSRSKPPTTGTQYIFALDHQVNLYTISGFTWRQFHLQ